MGNVEGNLKIELEEVVQQQRAKMDQIRRKLIEESDRFKKGLGLIIREHQQKFLQIHKEMKAEGEVLEKKMRRIHHTVTELLLEASEKKPPMKDPAGSGKADDLVNNPPNCTACEFPMIVLKEDRDATGSISVHFVCPICSIERKAMVSANGKTVDWGNSDAYTAQG